MSEVLEGGMDVEEGRADFVYFPFLAVDYDVVLAKSTQYDIFIAEEAVAEGVSFGVDIFF